ncbi:MAG: pyruvate kinase alpha/beta domain-containing protein, partial [candidate division WOR-3 bacterium]
VAHAVWNGTDALMLSGETAVGKYPVEAIKMLSQISKVAEQNRAWQPVQLIKDLDLPHTTSKLIASSVIAAVERGGCAAVIVPTASGTTARTIARARLPVPIIAVTDSRHTAANLKLSYGVYPVVVESFPEKWDLWTREFLSANRLKGKIALIIQGPSLLRPTQLHRIEYLILDN